MEPYIQGKCVHGSHEAGIKNAHTNDTGCRVGFRIKASTALAWGMGKRSTAIERFCITMAT